MKAAVVFDFDGVLANTEEAAYRVITRVARKKGVPLPSRSFLKNHTTQENLKVLKVRWWELPYYAALTRKWVAEEEPKTQLFATASKLLEIPRLLGAEVWIVSSNSKQAIEKAFLENSIQFPSERIRGGIGVFGKTAALKKLLKKEKLKPKNALYVGDETRDIDAARQAGMQPVAVTWGFHSVDLLRSHHPAYLITELAEFQAMMDQVLQRVSPSKV